MTSMKTVLLGSAAAIVATGAAQAADLPVKKAAAVQYVEVCPAFGQGFYRLPGSDICIKHFGYVKMAASVQDERINIGADGALAVAEGVSNMAGWEYSIRPGWDFRSPTAFGTLRTVVQLRSDRENGTYAGPAPSLTGGDSFSIQAGYIEWAGFLIGRSTSQYQYWGQDDVIGAIGGDVKVTTQQVSYVWAAPGGIRATIGLEDTAAWTVGVSDIATAAISGAGSTGPQRMYDVVASLSTEQAWGNAKVAGIIHQITSNSGATGLSETDIGWGVLGGITFNLPTLGAGDRLLLQAAYSDGVIAAGGVQGGASNALTQWGESGQYLAGLQRSDFDAYATTVTATTWDLQTTKVWSVAGQFRHYWNPLLRSNFMGSYSKVDVPAAASTGTLATGFRGDASAWDVGANLIWGKSRATVELGLEVAYKSVDQDLPAGTTAASITALGGDVNPSGWFAGAFIQRSW